MRAIRTFDQVKTVGAASAGTGETSRRTTDGPDVVDDTGRGYLMRLTVNLNRRSADALARASRVDRDSKTDTVNRALQVYALFQQLARSGDGTFCVAKNDGSIERILIL